MAVGAARIGPTASLTSTTTLTFTSPITANALLIAPGRAVPGVRVSLNGHPIPLAPPAPANAPMEIDVSAQAVPGLNILTITAPPHTSGAVVTVLARPVPGPAPP
ncbi:MAG: hypothetical protein NVSMB65_17900 [Chloroflexota bacterium]